MPVMTGTKRAKATSLTSNKTSIYGVVGGLAPRTGRQGGRNIQMWSANNKIVIPRDPAAAFCYMNHNNLLSENPAGSGSINKTLSNTPLHRLGYHRPTINDCGRIELLVPGKSCVCDGEKPMCGEGFPISLSSNFNLVGTPGGGPGMGLGQNNDTSTGVHVLVGWYAWVHSSGSPHTVTPPKPYEAMGTWEQTSSNLATQGFGPGGGWDPSNTKSGLFTLYGIYHIANEPGKYIFIIRHDTAGENINDTLKFSQLSINTSTSSLPGPVPQTPNPVPLGSSSSSVVKINKVIGAKILNKSLNPPTWNEIKNAPLPDQGCGRGIFALGFDFGLATPVGSIAAAMNTIFQSANGGNNPARNQLKVKIGFSP